MEKYSHGAFQVSGYKVTIHNPQEAQDVIKTAWHKFMQEGLSGLVENKAYQHVHAVYYNYTNLNDMQKEGYDMILGFVTEDGSVQSQPDIIDIVVPAQDYSYVKFTSDNFEIDLPTEWEKINMMTQTELNRTHGYDLEMYSEDYKTCTIAVSVGK
jgi:predicted transcriptional regulator YdeE